MSERTYRRLLTSLGIGLLAVVVWGFHSPAEGPPRTREVPASQPLVTDPGACYSPYSC